jgi:poly-gamma-glutamate capsule biosynthesis protein CapA/YwtB (metallophosphatase superfamily)
MKTERISACVVLCAIFLAGCATPAGNLTGSSTSPEITSTPTLFDPTVISPISTSGVSTSSYTETVNLTPTTLNEPSKRIILQAVGDIMLARSVGEQIISRGPEIVFAGVRSEFASADVLVGNLECSITTGGNPQPKSFTFAAPAEAARALALSGFTLLSLANNHAMDFGTQGLIDTRKTLQEHGIATVGAGANAIEAHSPFLLERNGLHLAFLAYVDVPNENGGFDAKTWIASANQAGVAWANPDQIISDVRAAKNNADVVIVLLHSGYEVNTYIPSISPDQQREAQAAIEAGAALVIGSHSHILQSIEWYQGGLIAYSLGNFVFDNYQGIANASLILNIVLTPAGVESYHWLPVLIEKGLPRLVTDAEVPAISTMVSP